MIEINLYAGKKPLALTKVAGIDLSLINVKMLLVALVILYVPGMILPDMYLEEITAAESVNLKLRKESRELAGKVKSLKNYKLQVDALKERENKLAKKIVVVKEIFKKKANPFNVLKYIAENTPRDVWIEELSIIGNQLKITGKAYSYTSIGSFIESLKKSVFFNPNIRYKQPTAKSGGKVKEDSFTINANIVSFK